MVPFYQTLVKDSEHEVRSNALTQFGPLSQVIYTRSQSKESTAPILASIKELLKVRDL